MIITHPVSPNTLNIINYRSTGEAMWILGIKQIIHHLSASNPDPYNQYEIEFLYVKFVANFT